MYRIIFSLALLHLVFQPAFTQELNNLNLGMGKYGDRSKDTLLTQLEQAGNDTGKVKLLVRVCCYYWRNEQNAEDSVLFYAQKAQVLSRQLNYQPGYNEACFMLCKMLAVKGKVREASAYISLVPKDQQARLLLVLGEQYLFLPGELTENLDTAYGYLQQALSAAEAAHAQTWKEQSLLALGKYHFSRGELKDGKEYILQIIRYYQQTGARAGEAHFWDELGEYMPETDSSYEDILNSFRNAATLYHAIDDKSNESSVLLNMAAVNTEHGRYDTAKKLALQGISIRQAAGNKRLFNYYLQLAVICQIQGNLDDALTYVLETRKNMIEAGDTNQIAGFYYVLGDIYADMGQPENSLPNFMKAINIMGSRTIYTAYRKTAEQMILLKENKMALDLLLRFEKRKPPARIMDKETMAGAKGDCYYALNQYDQAEKSYLQMIKLDELAQLNKGKELVNTFSLGGPAAYYKIARFYVAQQKYTLAAPYLTKSLQSRTFENHSSYNANLLKNIWWLQFKVDSATGNYLAAIRSYASYTAIKDSIFTISKVRQMQSLTVAYETSQKENNIQMLQKEGQLQQKKLDQSNQFRNFTIAGIVMLLLLLVLGYNRYRLKQKSNHQLQEKQEEITVQNEQLQHLVSEKEWLLKEVHHRVKNNLQTVVSLLELQSEYLNNEALSAIHDSQNRIYAMSLIHQKLYQSEVGASINMQAYLPELTAHLCDIYNKDRTIHFHLDISPIELDVSQAIPIGLIVNEAVTNSCKYAFTDPARTLDIRITLQLQPMDRIALTIADNGSGLPPNFNATSHAGLGFKLMMGLVEDLDGQLIIESHNGTMIKVYFSASIPLQEANTKPDQLKPTVI